MRRNKWTGARPRHSHGPDRCGQLATAVEVAQVFIPKTREQRELWVHFLPVASLSRLIFALSDTQPERRETAYAAGLLHDIGRFAMFECETSDFNQVAEAGWDTPEGLLLAERASLEYDHAQVGALICQRWGVPAPLVEVVQRHHDDPFSAHGDRDHALITGVRLADCVSMHVETNRSSMSERAHPLVEAARAHAKITTVDECRMVQIAEKLPEIESKVQGTLVNVLGLPGMSKTVRDVVR